MILAGDIGGTKTNLAVFDPTCSKPFAPRALASYHSAQYDSLEAILAAFIAEHRPGRIESACFGIAGPVRGDLVKTANIRWTVERGNLVRALGIKRVSLINDLEATAYGIEALGDEQLFTLNRGSGVRTGNRALIAAGTGLGMAGIFWDGARLRPIPSEGGHAGFAPRNEIETKLSAYLQRKLGGRVSRERVLSGPGLVNVYQFLRDEMHAEESARLVQEIAEADDAAARIGAAALAGESEVAARALGLFVEIYGAAAGDLALEFEASGGLYIGGGIAPKILDRLKDGSFMRAFADKGRMSSLTSSFPVCVILDDKTALYGAALRAQTHD
ncbi:MAG: glucokinase [Pyrinomonadaceae bacterium]